MLFLEKKNTDTIYAVLIDVSSGSIGFGIVESKKSLSLPTLVYTNRIPTRIPHTTAENNQLSTKRIREALLSTTLACSTDAIHALKEYAPDAHISQCFVTCSSPWAYTMARSVRYEEKETFKITKKILHDLIEGAEKVIYSKVHIASGEKELQFSIVEQATVDISINDYPVTHPYNLKGTSISLTHVAGLIPKDILSTIEEIQEKIFSDSVLRAHTYMLVIYCVLRDVFPKIHSSCIIDITGAATEFGIVENDLLITNSSIPLGSNTMTEYCAEASGRPAADIRSSLLDLPENAPVNLSQFEPFTSLYIEQLVAHIQKINEQRVFPEHIIISTHAPYTPLFKELIRQAIIKAVGREHIIVVIDTNLLGNIVNKSDQDLYLAVSARFFHKLHGCGEMHIAD